MIVRGSTEYTRVSCQALFQAIFGIEPDARAMVSWVQAKTLTMADVASSRVLLGY